MTWTCGCVLLVTDLQVWDSKQFVLLVDSETVQEKCLFRAVKHTLLYTKYQLLCVC